VQFDIARILPDQVGSGVVVDVGGDGARRPEHLAGADQAGIGMTEPEQKRKFASRSVSMPVIFGCLASPLPRRYPTPPRRYSGTRPGHTDGQRLMLRSMPSPGASGSDR
jgi:hypothetical protein